MRGSDAGTAAMNEMKAIYANSSEGGWGNLHLSGTSLPSSCSSSPTSSRKKSCSRARSSGFISG